MQGWEGGLGMSRSRRSVETSKASYLPYEVLSRILHFLALTSGHSRPQVAPCRVSKHWRIAAADILYKCVTLHSLRSAELLLRTLQEDTDGSLAKRIKVLHLPMIDEPPITVHYLLRYLVYDESGIPILSGNHRDVTILDLNHDDLR
jgi:hypothetical protein